jgi:hypothetical protein
MTKDNTKYKETNEGHMRGFSSRCRKWGEAIQYKLTN